MTLHQPEHEEAVLEFAFGDVDRDPARLLDQVSTCGECLTYVEQLLGDVGTLRQVSGREESPSAGALGRLASLKEIALQRRDEFEAEVVDLDEARRRREERTAARRPARTWAWGLAGGLMAAGLAVFLVKQQQDDTGPEPGAQAAAADIVPGLPATQGKKYADLVRDPGGAFGFGGAEAPDPFSRGFLVAVTLDLEPAPGQAVESDADKLRRELALQALQGLDDEEDDAMKRLRGGCGALVPAAEQRNCLAGQYAYRMRRDLDARIGAMAEAQARSDAAREFLPWALERVTDPKVRDAIEKVRARVLQSKPFDSEERILWGRILDDMGPFRR